MNDDQYFLADAYIDGELTDADVRTAEADPDVMSEVDRLRSVQSLLRHSDPPSASVRTAAIAAAMAEFTSIHGTAASSHVIPIRRQPPYSRYIGIAAAVVAIGAAGLVVTGVIGGGSDDDSTATEQAVTETFAQTEADVARSATTLAAATLATEMEAGADESLAASAPAEDAVGDIAQAESSSATTAASEGSADAAGTVMSAADTTAAAPTALSTPYPTTGGPIEPIADRDQTITTPGELAGLGVLLGDLRDAGELGATPETDCLFEDPAIEIVDTTRYRFSDVTVTVLVALVADGIEGHTLAIDPDTCGILVVGP